MDTQPNKLVVQFYHFNVTCWGNEKVVILSRCHIFNSMKKLDFFVIMMRHFINTHIRYFDTYTK